MNFEEFLNKLKTMLDDMSVDGEDKPEIPEPVDGFSDEPSALGGWSHSLLDETIADLKAGDSYAVQVAEDMPRAVVFDPRIKEMVPSDPDAAKLAKLAYRRYWAIQWIVNQDPVMLDFAVRKPDALTDDQLNDYYEHQDSHGVLLLPAGMDPETGIRKYVANRREFAVWLRENHEKGLDEIRPSPLG